MRELLETELLRTVRRPEPDELTRLAARNDEMQAAHGRRRRDGHAGREPRVPLRPVRAVAAGRDPPGRRAAVEHVGAVPRHVPVAADDTPADRARARADARRRSRAATARGSCRSPTAIATRRARRSPTCWRSRRCSRAEPRAEVVGQRHRRACPPVDVDEHRAVRGGDAVRRRADGVQGLAEPDAGGAEAVELDRDAHRAAAGAMSASYARSMRRTR